LRTTSIAPILPSSGARVIVPAEASIASMTKPGCRFYGRRIGCHRRRYAGGVRRTSPVIHCISADLAEWPQMLW
jgi:hypothetical protein